MNSFFAAQFSHCPLIWIIHNRSDNTVYIKNVYMKDWYTATKPRIKKYWKRISHYSPSKTFKQLLKCLKLKMACLLQLFLIYFCLERKSSQPYATKLLSFTFYTNDISCHWRFIFPRCKNVEQHIYRIKARIFSKNF